MKNFKFLSYLMIALASFAFMQCSSDYTAIPGIDGTDGIDGIDGVDGVDGVGVQECIDCHSSEHRDLIKTEYAISGHGDKYSEAWDRGNSTGCAQCHNNQGYIDYLSDLYVDTNGNQYVNPNYAYQANNNITCTGCHAQDQGHRSFDFETDGNDYALRNIDAVHLVIDPTVSVDLANVNEPLGLSNTCVTCHQPRNSYPVPSGTDNISITSYRYGPHHGPQSTLFEGIMAANIPGSVAYPGIGANGDNGHRKGTSCVGCHMSESTNPDEGGHTWNPSEESCTSCHTSGAPAEVTGFATDYEALRVLLVSKNLIEDSADAYVLGNDGVNRASGSNPLTAAVKDAQAIWNFKTLQEDKSKGVHNPKYTKALLKNTIEYLQSN